MSSIRKTICRVVVFPFLALAWTWVPASAADDFGQPPAVPPAYNPLSGPSYPLYPDSYFTDDAGNILMIINVLGKVVHPGQFIVRENVDFPTILAISGGLAPDANLKKVLIARREPDEKGHQAYILDLKSYYKTGDRSSFIALKPNDTVIIPEKGISLTKFAQAMSIVYPFAALHSIFDED